MGAALALLEAHVEVGYMAEENRVHRFGCMGQAEENVSDVRILHTTTTPIPKYMFTRF